MRWANLAVTPIWQTIGLSGRRTFGPGKRSRTRRRAPYFLKDPPMDVKAGRELRLGPGRSRGRRSALGNG